MKSIALFFLLTLPVFAAEVAVIDDTKTGDIMVSFTDDSLYAALDKTWISSTCKTRSIFNATVKETFTTRACRGETVKFILNNGYKPLDSIGRLFSR